MSFCRGLLVDVFFVGRMHVECRFSSFFQVILKMCFNHHHPRFVMFYIYIIYIYIMCSCFVALITSHVHHPNPNHVEPMGLDFGIWITSH